MVSVLVIAILFFSASCKKEESSSSLGSNASSLLYATLKGAAIASNDLVGASRMITISAFNNRKSFNYFVNR